MDFHIKISCGSINTKCTFQVTRSLWWSLSLWLNVHMLTYMKQACRSYWNNSLTFIFMLKLLIRRSPSTAVPQPEPAAVGLLWRCQQSLPLEHHLSLQVYWLSPPPGQRDNRSDQYMACFTPNGRLINKRKQELAHAYWI